MLILVGWRDDQTLQYLETELDKRCVKTKFIDFDRIIQADFDLLWASAIPQKAYLRWMIGASYYRNQNIQSMMSNLKELGDSNVLGRFNCNETNSSKFVHLQQWSALCRLHGIKTPLTHIGAGRGSALVEEINSGSYVVKGASSKKSICRDLGDQYALGYDGDDRAFGYLVQQKVTGPDVRVHCIGRTCVSEIAVSDEVDYRFALRKGFSYVKLPFYIRNFCIELTESIGAFFVGIDFKISSSGDWYFLEVNSAPAFQGYDRRSGGKIVDAIANWAR